MKTQIQKKTASENLGKAGAKQQPVNTVLQAYKSNTAQLAGAEEEDPLQKKSDTAQLEEKEEEPAQLKADTAQLADAKEEEPVQQKSNTAPLADAEEEPAQLKTDTAQLAEEEEPIQQKSENRTGLPDNLKAGVENLSGYSMDDVKVHYNSSKPATLQAHAYAQGTDIHIASGQEKHLPHEAWHVAQQKQGRVQPTMQMKDKVNVNDDAGLEKEADVMGAKAMQMKEESSVLKRALPSGTMQLKTDVREIGDAGSSSETSSKKIQTPTQGLKWFRFSKSGEAINSFSNNIYPGSTDKGSNPVSKNVELGAQATKDSIDTSTIPDMSRSQHFALGDKAAAISKDSRKGKWTWHHQDGKYYMELVDMHVHGGFGHTGGFSQWQEDDNDVD